MTNTWKKEARDEIQDSNRKNDGERVYHHMQFKLYHILNSGEEQFNKLDYIHQYSYFTLIE